MRYIVHPVTLSVAPNLRISGGPRFESDYWEDDSGTPQSSLLRPCPKWEWTLLFKRNSRDFGALTAFFLARMGKGYGWFFEDPYDRTDSDNGGTGLVRTLDDGKRYLVKQYQDAYSPHVRRIRCPLPGTVQFSGVGGSPVVDPYTGEVTGATSDGAASFQFRNAVLFTSDEMEVTRNAGNGVGEWANVELLELSSFIVGPAI